MPPVSDFIKRVAVAAVAAALVVGFLVVVIGAGFVAAGVMGLAILCAAGWWAVLAAPLPEVGEYRMHDVERLALDELRAEMVTTVSHELRTPLTVVSAAAATLSRRWDVLSEAQRMDLIDVLVDNAASLDASIMHFVDAARLEHGKVMLSPTWINLDDAIGATVSRLSTAMAGHEVRTELEAASVWADAHALDRMLEHLLLNAARFSAMGTPIAVRSFAATTGDEIVIKVVDRGQGMAPHVQATAWEPLQRGDVEETGISRGAGLGLPIVRELARLHGGDANLVSIRGRGTTVAVSLPQPPKSSRHVAA